MMVDVGTGYFVQKDQQKTAEFLGRKVSAMRTEEFVNAELKEAACEGTGVPCSD